MTLGSLHADTEWILQSQDLNLRRSLQQNTRLQRAASIDYAVPVEPVIFSILHHLKVTRSLRARSVASGIHRIDFDMRKALRFNSLRLLITVGVRMKKLSSVAVCFGLLLAWSPAKACLGPAEFFTVVHPQILEALVSQFQLTVGDVLALTDRIKVTSGSDLLTKMKKLNGETYYLVSGPGSLALKNDHGDSAQLRVIEPPRVRGNGCQDHRKVSKETPQSADN